MVSLTQPPLSKREEAVHFVQSFMRFCWAPSAGAQSHLTANLAFNAACSFSRTCLSRHRYPPLMVPRFRLFREFHHIATTYERHHAICKWSDDCIVP
jgi:hypothetical protein